MNEGDAVKEFEPAERDPGEGWLRSRLYRRGSYRQRTPYRLHDPARPGQITPLPWPRTGHRSACGRDRCVVCDPTMASPPA